jgi:hypothetical protein
MYTLRKGALPSPLPIDISDLRVPGLFIITGLTPTKLDLLKPYLQLESEQSRGWDAQPGEAAGVEAVQGT